MKIENPQYIPPVKILDKEARKKQRNRYSKILPADYFWDT